MATPGDLCVGRYEDLARGYDVSKGRLRTIDGGTVWRRRNAVACGGDEVRAQEDTRAIGDDAFSKIAELKDRDRERMGRIVGAGLNAARRLCQ